MEDLIDPVTVWTIYQLITIPDLVSHYLPLARRLKNLNMTACSVPAYDTRYVTRLKRKNIYVCINTIQESYFFQLLIKNAADTLYFHLAIFTPRNGVTGIPNNSISNQRHGDIILT